MKHLYRRVSKVPLFPYRAFAGRNSCPLMHYDLLALKNKIKYPKRCIFPKEERDGGQFSILVN